MVCIDYLEHGFLHKLQKVRLQLAQPQCLISHYPSDSQVTEEVELTEEWIGHILVERILVLVVYPMLQGSSHQILQHRRSFDGKLMALRRWVHSCTLSRIHDFASIAKASAHFDEIQQTLPLLWHCYHLIPIPANKVKEANRTAACHQI